LHGPIGLEIGAGTPEEIAMAIMAQIVAAHNKAEKVAVSHHEKIRVRENR